MKKIMAIIISFEAFVMYLIMLERWEGTYGKLIVESAEKKPYVYRALVPLVSRILGRVSFEEPEVMMQFVFVLSAVCSFWAMKYLFDAFYKDGEILAFVSFQVLYFVCMIQTKVYDYATAAFFSLSFGLMARGKHRAFLILFPFATLNRETTFLLTLFYSVWFFGKIPFRKYAFSVAYQVSVYLAEKIIIQSAFSNNGGQPIYFELFHVVSAYIYFWPYLLLLIPLAFIVAKAWKKVPEFFRIAMIVIFPVQVILHLLFGLAFEIRVFAESVSIIVPFITAGGYIFSKDRANSIRPMVQTKKADNLQEN